MNSNSILDELHWQTLTRSDITKFEETDFFVLQCVRCITVKGTYEDEKDNHN